MRRRDLLVSALWAGPVPALLAQAPVPGKLVIIGGAEDRVQDRTILRCFLELAGGPQARIRLLAAASSVPLLTADSYRNAFAGIGATDCELLPLQEGDGAFSQEVVQGIREADAIFITGGSQSRLMDVLRDSPALAALQDAHWRLGRCIAGTSAGAAVMSRHMIAQGPAVPSPRKDIVRTGTGLGLLPAAIVDQHFSQRGRFARLLSAIAQRPDLLGVGVDEDTALIVEPGEAIEIVGKGAVTLMDPSRMRTDAGELESREPIEMLGVQLHALPAGHRYAVRDSRESAGWPVGLREAVRRLVAVRGGRG